MSELKMGTSTKQQKQEQEHLQFRLECIQNKIEELQKKKKDVEKILKLQKRGKKILVSTGVVITIMFEMLTIKKTSDIKNYENLTKVYIDEFDSLGRHTIDDELALEENAENYIICKIHGQYTKDENGNYVKPIYHYSVDLKEAIEIASFINAVENLENQYANMDIDNLGILHLQKVTYDKKENLSQEEYESEGLVQLQVFSTSDYKYSEYTEDEIITEFNHIELSKEELQSKKNRELVFGQLSLLPFIIIEVIYFVLMNRKSKKLKNEIEEIDDEIDKKEVMKRAIKLSI